MLISTLLFRPLSEIDIAWTHRELRIPRYYGAGETCLAQVTAATRVEHKQIVLAWRW